ncbi:MAG: response regulator transcription factor [Anaerolineales bacterium]|nr:response regulator transcription factor [Anaerolineales bacterium]
MSKTLLLSNHPIKVFIADDSIIVREHLVIMLDELSGVEMVGQAEDVAEAVSAIQNLQPDVVILDIRMPGGSGIDVLQNIKQDGAGPVVIMLTNYPFAGYRKKCLQAGADFFLDKSTEFDQIPKLFERLKQHPRFDQAQPD